ncbi:MAG: hypothetical protein ACREFE_19715, partial [Limisphaerales bacterium]
MKMLIKRTVLLSAMAALSAITTTAFGQTPGAIGVNFTWADTSYSGDGPHLLAPDDAAGVVALTNWNNLQAEDPSSANTM